MAGVLEQIRRPRKQLVERNSALPGINPKILQLQAAKEILAEVFSIRTLEVDEMLKQRYEGRNWSAGQRSLPDEGLWPREFCLEG